MPTEDLPAALLKQYDISPADIRFTNMLLSAQGLRFDEINNNIIL